MKFSFEVPTAYLEYFHEYQDYIFALSFMLKEDRKYNSYIHDSREKGLKIIIDNSANEMDEPTKVKDMACLFSEFPNEYIISPDWLDWGLMEQIKNAKKLSDFVPKKYIITPINNVNWIGYYNNEGFTNIAMGYNLRYLSDTDLVKLKGHHFLGLNSIRELFVGQPSSCDTGLPIKLARENMTVKRWIEQGCPHIQTRPDFFNWHLTPAELYLSRKNMDTLKKIGELIHV